MTLAPARRGFASDNAATVHPRVLESIAAANVGHAFGYGHDPYTHAVEQRLAALRMTYEPLIGALSQFLLLAVPDWLPSATPDNWQMGTYGGLAAELVDGPGSPAFPLAAPDETTRADQRGAPRYRAARQVLAALVRRRS